MGAWHVTQHSLLSSASTALLSLNEKIFASSDMMITEAWPDAVALPQTDSPKEIGFLINLISDKFSITMMNFICDKLSSK